MAHSGTRKIQMIDTGIASLVVGIAGKRGDDIDYSLSMQQVRRRERDILAGATSLPPGNIAFMSQVHQDAIHLVDLPPGGEIHSVGEADGLITDVPGICLVIRTADCVPVFMYDVKRHVLGAAHSGWRGTRLVIARKLARTMRERYGSDYSDIVIYILPSIGPESYEVGKEVFDLFPRGRIERNGKMYLDLWENIEASLIEEGILRENIHNSSICTLKEKDRFYSHRGGDEGRNLNFAVMR